MVESQWLFYFSRIAEGAVYRILILGLQGVKANNRQITGEMAEDPTNPMFQQQRSSNLRVLFTAKTCGKGATFSSTVEAVLRLQFRRLSLGYFIEARDDRQFDVEATRADG
jgi:hypothetical protein